MAVGGAPEVGLGVVVCTGVAAAEMGRGVAKDESGEGSGRWESTSRGGMLTVMEAVGLAGAEVESLLSSEAGNGGGTDREGRGARVVVRASLAMVLSMRVTMAAAASVVELLFFCR